MSACDYAVERAIATGRRYIVSSMGHVMLDCPENREAFAALGVAVVYVAV